MSKFEFVMVVVAILLGMSLVQTIRGLGSAVRSQSRYVPLTLWLVVLFIQHVQLWWSLWDLESTIRDWTLGTFYLIVLVPCSLLAATDALAPRGAASDVDAREHFYRVSPWFYSLLLLYTGFSVAWTWLLDGVALDHFLRVLEATGALAIVMGLVWRDRNVHSIAAVLYLLMLLVGQLMFRPSLMGA
mgnify:CR=1 FL=1